MNLLSDLDRECQTLRHIAEGVADLIAQKDEANVSFGVADRGYFLPNEDDQARHIFTSYLNYRNALYEIIHRRENFNDVDDEQVQAESFLLCFGSAVMLFNWSTHLVAGYQDSPAIRRKLNEADARYGIEENLFDQIKYTLSRVEVQQRLSDAAAYFDDRHERFMQLFPDGDYNWLIREIEKQYTSVKKTYLDIWSTKLKTALPFRARQAREPFSQAAYKVQSWIFELFGNLWYDAKPQVPDDHIEQFEKLLAPGDFLIVRPEKKTSTVFLPGWWTHATMYIGSCEQLAAYKLQEDEYVKKYWEHLQTADQNGPIRIIEALAAGVVFNSMRDSLRVDHVVAFSPKISDEERADALTVAFSNVGKFYDFDFDFSRSDRMVCTEVVYRSMFGKGKIAFTPSERMGRPTLSADDIVSYCIKDILASGDDAAVEFKGISTRDANNEASFLTGEAGFARLRQTLQL